MAGQQCPAFFIEKCSVKVPVSSGSACQFIHKCDRAERLTLTGSSINYAVYLDQERLHKHKRVVLAESGTLVCEQ